MGALTEFLYPAPARRSLGGIVVWWERRRLAYNVAVGTAGLVSLAVAYAYSAVMGFEPPPLIVPVVFGVMANVCYLLGPAVEILIEKLCGRSVLPTGPGLYRMGLTFSVGLALFPILVIGLVTLLRITVGLF